MKYKQCERKTINRNLEVAKVGGGMSFNTKIQMLDTLNSEKNVIVLDPKGDINNLVSQEILAITADKE